MKDVLWFGAIAALALPGTIAWRLPLASAMPRAARWAVAWVAGVMIAALLLYVYALVGLRWTRVDIGIPLLLLTGGGMWVRASARTGRAEARPYIVIGVFALLLIYAIADARSTCGDLIYIWAPKAQAFANARTIDVQFLAFPHYYLMHPDYPPLVPLVFNIGSIAAHQFSLWGALFLTVLVVFAITGIARGFGAPPMAAAFLFASLAFASAVAYLPGGADPFLLLFESTAVIALTFAPESRDARWIAAAALAAAAFTKVEGASFAVIAVIAYLMAERRLLRGLALLVPTIVLLGSWLLFASHYHLLDQYARAKSPMYWNQLPTVFEIVKKRAGYNVNWWPWLAVIVPLFTTRVWRRAAFPLLVAAGTTAAMIYFYLHNEDPRWWIEWSADRLLVTPFMCLAVASAAAGWDVVEPDRLADAAVIEPA